MKRVSDHPSHGEETGCCAHDHENGGDGQARTEVAGGGHQHGSGHSHAHGASPKAMKYALAITLSFMVLEAIGGYLANSLALLSDAAHMLTDAGAMILGIVALWISRRPYTPKMSYGYHRAEILGALTNGLTIWLIAGMLVYEAIRRLSSPPEVQGHIVFVVASIGLLANLASMRFLHSEKHHSLNVRAVYLHVVADMLGSIGAIVAGLVLWLTGWRPIDLIITFLSAVLMLISSWELVKESVGILMESAPRGVDPLEVREDLKGLEGVDGVHDLHVWTLSSGRLALSAHLLSRNPQGVLAAANRMLSRKYSIVHTTLQIEHPDEFSGDRCFDCHGEG